MASKKAAPPVETLERIDLDEEEDFSDVDGDLGNEFALKDADKSDLSFVWVHNDPSSIGEYKGSILGYEPVHQGQAGVQVCQDPGYAEGEIITKRDHVLMACDRFRAEKRGRFLRKKNAEMRAQMFRAKASGETKMKRNANGQWVGMEA